MKKVIKLLSTFILILSLFTACSSTNSKQPNTNDIRVTFVTTQGEINCYLYPEAAPLAVANFINLAKRGYYTNTKFHRAIDNYIVQGGDPTGKGDGNPGYSVPDEFVDWLNFYHPGILAMANTGTPNSSGSQFFFTLYPADQLNYKYAIIGEAVGENDFNNIKKLEVGDIVKEIKFRGKISQFLSAHKEQIEKWNKILDKKYPKLKKYPII